MANKDTFVDPSTGKRYKLSDFDDSASRTRAPKKATPKADMSTPRLLNLLGKT